MHVQSLTFLLCVHLNSECKSFVIKSYSRMQTYVIIKTETWIKEIKGFITKCLWDTNCYSVLSIHFCFYDFDPLFLSVLACSICLRVLRAVPTVTSPASEQMSNDDMWKNVVMWTCHWDIKWGDAERLLTEAEVSLCSLSFSKAWQNAWQRFIHTVSTAVKLVLIFASDCGWGSKHKHNAQNVKGKMAQKMASLPTHQRT